MCTRTGRKHYHSTITLWTSVLSCVIVVYLTRADLIQLQRRTDTPMTVDRIFITAFTCFVPQWKAQFAQRQLWRLTIIALHHNTPAKFLTWLAVTRLGRGSVSQPSGILIWICTSLCKKQRIKNNWCNILNWTGNVSEAPGILVSLLPRYPPQ